jgi:hypothetical protein
MNTIKNVDVSETESTDDAVNVSDKREAEHNKKTSGTKTPKPPKGGSAESLFHRADDAELGQQLEDCKSLAADYQNLTGRTDRALHEALARSYVWWRACTEGESRFPDYLTNANINHRTGTREFSDLIRLTFSLSGDGKSKAEKRWETKTVNRFATAMDSIHRHFETQEVTFGEEVNITAHISQEGGVEALIQKALGRKSGKAKTRYNRRKVNLQAGTQVMKRAYPLAIIPKHSHDLERDNEEDRDFVMLLGEVDHSGDVKVLTCLRHKSMVQSALTSIGSDHFEKKSEAKAESAEANQKSNFQNMQDELVADALKKTPKAKTETDVKVLA